VSNDSPTQAELDAAFAAVRALVNARAGWYASMISDDMLKAVVFAALTAAANARGGTTSAAAPKS